MIKKLPAAEPIVACIFNDDHDEVLPLKSNFCANHTQNTEIHIFFAQKSVFLGIFGGFFFLHIHDKSQNTKVAIIVKIK